jgi:hypothetical protein
MPVRRFIMWAGNASPGALFPWTPVWDLVSL